jgi:hypothetical protein
MNRRHWNLMNKLALSSMVGYSRIMPMNGNATGLLGRVMEPLGRCMTPASAKEILSVRADETAVARLEELASRSDAGTLTPDERAEYRLFVEVGDLLAILQAKARRYLAEHPGA